MKSKALVLGIGAAFVLAGCVFLFLPFFVRRAKGDNAPITNTPPEAGAAAKESSRDRLETVEIPPKATFSALMEEQGLSSADVAAIYQASREAYDLAAIRAGRKIELSFDRESGACNGLMYPISDEEELHVRKEADGWKAAKETIAYDIRFKTVKGSVSSSLYAAGLEQGMDERAVIEMGDAFQWTIDFAQDVRVGDTFAVVYEERYRDGAYAGPGRILAAKYVNAGTPYQAFLFENAKGEAGYYDEKGNSQRKMFLKAPVAFKYITSGFTTGRRYVSAFNVSTGHRAIDYAATLGTPIRATADGVVAFAGWDGPYGNKITIRHNGTYSTNYCHQSKFAVKKGQHVVQGQVIGYVGSTGFSTGPHLHYEMVKNGVKINPLNETFPGTDPIAAEELPAFQTAIAQWAEALQ